MMTPPTHTPPLYQVLSADSLIPNTTAPRGQCRHPHLIDEGRGAGFSALSQTQNSLILWFLKVWPSIAGRHREPSDQFWGLQHQATGAGTDGKEKIRAWVRPPTNVSVQPTTRLQQGPCGYRRGAPTLTGGTVPPPFPHTWVKTKPPRAGT